MLARRGERRHRSPSRLCLWFAVFLSAPRFPRSNEEFSPFSFSFRSRTAKTDCRYESFASYIAVKAISLGLARRRSINPARGRRGKHFPSWLYRISQTNFRKLLETWGGKLLYNRYHRCSAGSRRDGSNCLDICRAFPFKLRDNRISRETGEQTRRSLKRGRLQLSIKLLTLSTSARSTIIIFHSPSIFISHEFLYSKPSY